MKSYGLAGLACLIGLSQPAFAAGPPEEAAAAPKVETPAEAGAKDEALPLDELGALRGGQTIVIQGSTHNLTAVNTGNTVSGDTIGSGAMNINANAFSGYDGIGNFVMNTGHNNNLMGSVSVNITAAPQ